MALCNPFGLLAYNLTEPAPHGFITRKLVKEYPAGVEPDQLNNPVPGQTFKQVEDPTSNSEDPPLVWIEERVLLPSNSLGVEFIYRTRSTSENVSLAQFGEESGSSLFGIAPLGAGAGTLGLAIANNRFLGGITPVNSTFVWHASSTVTQYDIPIKITEDILDTGQVSLPDYIMTVIGVFDEPLNLSESEKSRIGLTNDITRGIQGEEIYNGSMIEGQSPRDLDGDGEQEIPAFFSESSNPEEAFQENNRYRERVKDERVYRFRSDNSKSSVPLRYGFTQSPEAFQDLSSKKFNMDVSGLQVGDTVYLSGSFVTKHYFRQMMRHDAALAELPSNRAGSNNIVPIKSNIDSFNFQMSRWRVSKDININKVDISVFSSSQDELSEEDRYWDEVEGWRLSDMIAKNDNDFYAVDFRGILKVDKNGKSTVIVPIENVQTDGENPSWLQDLLTQEGLLESTFDEEFNENIDLNGHMFDLNEVTNSVLIDNEKLAYWRPFALALQKVSDSIGVTLLDLIENKITTSDESVQNLIDLSNAKFLESGNVSTNPGSYSSLPCAGATGFESAGIDGDTGSFYAPNDPLNRWSLFIPIPAGDLFTDWILRTTFFRDRYDRNTRIFVESFLPDGALTRRYSSIYVRTTPKVESSLSLDTLFNKDEAFVVFSDDDGLIRNYRLRDGYLQRQLSKMSFFAEGTHSKPAFDFDDFKYIGYNLAVGDTPSFSIGSPLSTDRVIICNTEGLSFSDIYEEKSFDLEVGSNSSDISTGSEDLFRNIDLTYNIINNKGLEDDNLAIEFESTSNVVNNISVPISVGNHRVKINSSFYGGSPMKIYGDFLQYAESAKLDAVTTTDNKISPYFISASQIAIGIDGKNRVLVFYADESSNNISVAISGDLGKNWWNFSDIIMLKQGESADSPYVVMDKKLDICYLFYKLNGRFLMVKKIFTDWFYCDDQFLSYVPLGEFDEESDDLLGIEQYSEGGKSLRQETSYFVVGDGEESKFTTEIEQAEARRKSGKKTIRFNFSGNVARQMDRSFNSSDYAVWMDNKSNFRVIFFNDEGRMFLKQSSDYKNWIYLFKNVIVHKNLLSDDPNLIDLGVETPQVVYDKLKNSVYLFYFYQGSMFVRRFDNELLYPQSEVNLEEGFFIGENESEYLAESIYNHIKILKDSPNNPYFIVGEIPITLRDSLNNNLEDLVVNFVYSQEQVDKFDNRFAIDTNARPVGYSTKPGLIRCFYRTDENLVYGLSLNGMTPSLDCQLRFNPEATQSNSEQNDDV